jgi:AraC-like DNA-binding protein
MRAEAALRQLEGRDQGLKQIAVTCGFSYTDSMRRAFLRSVGTTPHEYRRQFHGLNGALDCREIRLWSFHERFLLTLYT